MYVYIHLFDVLLSRFIHRVPCKAVAHCFHFVSLDFGLVSCFRREPANDHERRAQDAGGRGGDQEPGGTPIRYRTLQVNLENPLRKSGNESGEP